MCQLNRTQNQHIYYDVTAGRGSYDDEYPEQNVDLNQFKNIAKHVETETNDEPTSNEYHTTFKNFAEPKKLPKQNFNDLQQQRRHSYSRGQPRGRAAGRNYSQPNQNYSTYENNRQHANEVKSGYKSDNMHNGNSQQVEITWCPKRISKV